MKLALLAFIAACVALSASPAASPAAGGPGKPTITLNYIDITTSSARTISENRPPKLGDLFSFHDEFYKWNGTKRGAHIGHADGTAVYLGHGMGQISGVGSFAGGTVNVAGELSFSSRTSTLAVIGGTGAYATARGELTIRTINSTKSAQTLRLWL